MSAPLPTQHQARALGDPTRYRIFRYLLEADRAVGVAELTGETNLNHNAVRQHLTKLRSAGLVMEATEARRRPGRPRLLYRVDPDLAGSWETIAPYQRLSLLLAEVASSGKSPLEVGRAVGRREAIQASDLGARGSGVDALQEEMTRQGFRPQRRWSEGNVELVLERCPFESVARAHPDLVCPLHQGLAEGLAGVFSDVEVAALVPRDPTQAGCRLVLRSLSSPGSNSASERDRTLT